MSESIESIILKMKLDQAEVDAGTAAMLSKQRAAGREYVSVWESALAKKDAAEKIELDASFARYQENLAKKAEADRIYFAQRKAMIEEQAAIEAIANGSGGFGSMGGGSKGGGGGGNGDHGSRATLSRESMVLVREFMRGNYGKMLGSFTILLNAMGGQIQKMMQSLFGAMGMMIGAAGAAAYALWIDIKNFSKGMDEMSKQNAESIGNSKKAIKEATDEGIASAAEFEAHIRSLAQAHETLAHWVSETVKQIQAQAAAQEQLLTAQGNRQVAGINLSEHMGMMTGDQASAARTKSQAGTFVAVEKAKQDALVQEGQVLANARNYATRSAPLLESAGRRAQYAETGVDERGNVVNRAAFERNKRMKERENIQSDVTKRQGQVEGFEKSLSIDPLGNAKNALNDGNKEIIAKEQALLKQKEEQNKNDIAAQKAAEQAYKDAVKAIDDNAEALKSVNESIEAYKSKYKDATTALQTLHSDLVAKALNNQSDQIDMQRGMDRVSPTIETLAGDPFMSKLNKAYGKGGQYDLGAGDGKFAGVAQDYELAQKQQQWDIIHGNAKFNEQGQLIDAEGNQGQAFRDQQRATGDRQLLGQAGVQTPAMQMADLIKNGQLIQNELITLNGIMKNAPKVTFVDSP